MSPIDWSVLALPKSKPGVVRRAEKKRAAKTAWKKTAKAVDKRDSVDEAPQCFITGKRLQTANQLDEWTFRDRCHIEPRSREKARTNDVSNVISCSRGVHKLIDRSVLLLLDKKLKPAKSVKAIFCVAWNRRMLPKKDAPPCRIRKGLPVVELDAVRD